MAEKGISLPLPSVEMLHELEARVLGWQLAGDRWIADAVTSVFVGWTEFAPPHDEIQRAILSAHNVGLIVSPASIALKLASNAELHCVGGAEYLRNITAAAPAFGSERDLRQQIFRSHRTWEWAHAEIVQSRKRAQADQLLRDGGIEAFLDAQELLKSEGRTAVTASPYEWTEPESIPTRRFIFSSRHAIAEHVSITGAFGGGGKSSLLVAECLAHCTGENLLDDAPLFRGSAWYLGLEDPLDEHHRRIAAAALLHKLHPNSFAGRLFLNDASQEFVVARDTRDGLTIAEPIIDGIIAQIRANKITLLVVDPFVASHNVGENDNGAIDTVARIWVRIARETGAAIELVHHLRKSNGMSEPSDDDFRGASALIPAVRSARLLRTMTKEEAEKSGVDEHFRFFRLMDGKKNMGPRSANPAWRELVPMNLKNGDPPDHVAAVTAWKPSEAADALSTDELAAIVDAVRGGSWRANPQSSDWVGNPIAKAMGLDMNETSARATVKAAIARWLKQGVLCTYEAHDNRRKTKTFIGVPQ